jgi:hypothetical protein
LAVSGEARRGTSPRWHLLTCAVGSYTPEFLREQIAELKSELKDKNAPFGVDLLLPKVGGEARKTSEWRHAGDMGTWRQTPDATWPRQTTTTLAASSASSLTSSSPRRPRSSCECRCTVLVPVHQLTLRAVSSAVGVAPKEVIEKLHKAGIVCAGIIGHPKHVKGSLAVRCSSRFSLARCAYAMPFYSPVST